MATNSTTKKTSTAKKTTTKKTPVKKTAAKTTTVKEVTDKINELNKKIITEDKNFIEAVNELKYSLKFIYFAIFKYENNRNVENFRSAIEEILTEFNQQIENIKINKYNVEIVFVPTFNDSMDLKNKMEE